MYAGPQEADWGIDLFAYPDLLGHPLRGIIGPDTITPGASTTTTALTVVNATTINVTSATGIIAGTYISIDTGVLQEYALVTNVASLVLTVTTVQGQAVGLLKGHASGVTVVAQTTHTFKQSATAARATYSLTVYDTSTGTPTLGYSYAAFSDVGIKIDPKGAVTLNTKLKAFPGAVQSPITPTYTALAPVLGWQWSLTNAGASSNRGLSMDLTLKRAVEAIHSSNGLQAPREIFQGVFDADGTLKVIFESLVDLNLFTNYTQTPTTSLLQQPVAFGGASVAFTMSQSGWFKGKRDLATPYVQADFSLAGIYNTTDTGSLAAVLKNFVTTAY
jgi:hypothetical protein